MGFYLNVGYRFTVPHIDNVEGSVLLASAMPMHQLERRRIDHRYPHMENRIFDPQLYMVGLDAFQTPKHCSCLASYPWFGVESAPYDSSQQRQSQWRKAMERTIAERWRGQAPSEPGEIISAARAAVDFQMAFGCRCVVLPSPLTRDPGSSYEAELLWLDAGLEYTRSRGEIKVPIYATIALQDLCLWAVEPHRNELLELIADAVTAREVDGAYIVVEQGSEPDDTRHCGSTRTLHAALHLVHLLANDGNVKVFVNSLGAFGLVCKAAGARDWATGWYKSLYRVRLADRLAGGRAYPTYWSSRLISDIHLDRDFDRLVQRRYLERIATETPAAEGLLRAARSRQQVAAVADWEHRQSNVSAAREHFLTAVSSLNNQLTELPFENRLAYIEEWLSSAASLADEVGAQLGSERKTKLNHPAAWAAALSAYKEDHRL